jgi:hypothetical protein
VPRPVPSKKSKWVYICVLRVCICLLKESILSLSTILIFDFGICSCFREILKRKLKVMDEYKMVKDLPKEGQKRNPQQHMLIIEL